MDQHQYTLTVQLPTVDEYTESYPHYGPRARGDGRQLFELVMRPQTFVDAAVLTRRVRVPAVMAIAEEAVRVADGNLSNTDRQFLGTLVCALMESNGFVKTGRKGSIPHRNWNRGEIYAEDAQT